MDSQNVKQITKFLQLLRGLASLMAAFLSLVFRTRVCWSMCQEDIQGSVQILRLFQHSKLNLLVPATISGLQWEDSL